MKLVDTAQFKNGKDVEAYLDGFFRARGWTIWQTTPYEERVLCMGDRHFMKDAMALKIEYKSGIQTRYTGNIFLETVSVDAQQKPGWVYTCKADFVFYAALLNGEILIFTPNILRDCIEYLKAMFPQSQTRHRQNDGYNTHGVLVPLDYAENCLAVRVIRI